MGRLDLSSGIDRLRNAMETIPRLAEAMQQGSLEEAGAALV
jgi:hypothetical protein